MPRTTHTGCSPNTRARLGLEALEDRLALSASPVIDLSGLSVGTGHASDRILVRYREGAAPVALAGTSVGGQVGLVQDLYRVNLSSETTVDAALAAYRADGRVAGAEADHFLSAAAVPNDPRFAEQWSLNGAWRNVDALSAWSSTTGASKLTVAVMDTGMDYTHPDLYENVWLNQGEIPADVKSRLIDVDGDALFTFRDLNDARNAAWVKDVNANGRIDAGDLLAPRAKGGWADGVSNDGDKYVDDLVGWDFADDNNNPMDTAGHGTHVSGIIGAMGNNGVGVAGIAWDVQLMPVRFIGAGGGSVSQFIAGLDYAVKKGAKVSNNSWSGASASQMLIDAVTAARDAGQVFVAAAGNYGYDNDVLPTYPASLALDNVISVAATDRNGALASFSNYGAKSVDVAAPGVDILSTTLGGGYGNMSGTSMATPHVTGIIVLAWAKNPTWTYKQVIARVFGTSEESSALAGKASTGGIANAAAAVGFVQTAATAKVVASTPSGPTATTLTSVRVSYDKAIDFSTFTAADATLTLPNGTTFAVSNVKEVSGSNGKSFDVVFAIQSAPGAYVLKIGTGIKDTTGVPVTAFTGSYTLPTATATATGAKIVSATQHGPTATTMSSVRVTFDRAIAFSTFTAADATLTLANGAVIAVSNVKEVSGSNGKSFDVVFALQSVPGTYTLKVGPNVKDLAGVNMVAYVGSFKLPTTGTSTTAAKVVGATKHGPTSTTMSSVRVTFDRAMNLATFTAADATLTLPNGTTIAVSNIKAVDGTGGKSFDVVFATQSVAGTYTVKIGPNVQDLTGVNMTAYVGTFALGTAPAAVAPKVIASTASGPSASTLTTVRVTFDKAMQLATFTAADAVLSGPAGAIAVTGVKVVAGSGDRAFDVTFAAQSKPGTYTLKVGPNVKDLAGTNMVAFTGTYKIAGGTPTYTSTGTAAITPNGRAVLLLTVPDGLTIADVNVRINLTHPRLKDLFIHLQSPEGIDVTLSKQLGGTSANMVGTVFDDEASVHVALGTGPYTGSYQPLAPLSILDGRSAKGTWKLWVEDRGGVNRGTVENFSLVITPKAG